MNSYYFLFKTTSQSVRLSSIITIVESFWNPLLAVCLSCFYKLAPEMSSESWTDDDDDDDDYHEDDDFEDKGTPPSKRMVRRHSPNTLQYAAMYCTVTAWIIHSKGVKYDSKWPRMTDYGPWWHTQVIWKVAKKHKMSPGRFVAVGPPYLTLFCSSWILGKSFWSNLRNTVKCNLDFSLRRGERDEEELCILEVWHRLQNITLLVISMTSTQAHTMVLYTYTLLSLSLSSSSSSSSSSWPIGN